MTFREMWQDLRERCETLDSDAILVTPTSERAFTVDTIRDDRVGITFVGTSEERTLWRHQFEVLYDRLETESNNFPIDDLPGGVEPYVSVMSLSPRYMVDSKAFRRAEDEDAEESPFLKPAWTARTPPERVHDDALLLVDALEQWPVDDLDSVSPENLVDVYVLLSDVQRGSDGFRTDVTDRLLEYIGPDARLHGRFGTVQRTTRNRRHLKDEETILNALDAEDVPHEWVLGVDPDKLDVVLAATDVDEDDVYDIEQQVYVQKIDVEESEKQSRLQGLKNRLDELDTAEAAELRDDIEELEDRLETVLAAG